MGTATANGSRRAIEAAQKAIASPLLEAGAIDGARGILINITGSASLKLAEVQEACGIIQNAADDDANIIFGAVMDEKMKDAVKITVIATGFREAPSARHRPQETRMSFSASHAAALEDPMDFPDGSGPRTKTPEHIMSSEVTSFDDSATNDRAMNDGFTNDRDYADDSAPVPISHATGRMSGEVNSLDCI